MSNQYRILEAHDPNNNEYVEAKEALERGYALNYEWICEHICDTQNAMSLKECQLVINILQMFQSIWQSYAKLDERAKDEINESDLTFLGFDGNAEDEGRYMAYAKYLYATTRRPFGLDEFPQFNESDNFNSHCLTLPMYERMWEAWNQAADIYNLTVEDLRCILAARTA